MAKVELTLGEVSVIAQSNLVVTETMKNFWGFYQFPTLTLTEEGDFLCTYSVNKDDISSYGLPLGRAVSKDLGKTWENVPGDDNGAGNGVLLPNGDRVRAANFTAYKVKDYQFPAKPNAEMLLFGRVHRVYHAKDITPQVNYWFLERLKAGSDQWEMESHYVPFPEEGVLTLDDMIEPYCVHRLYLRPDGKLWMLGFCCEPTAIRLRAILSVSEDMGRTFRYVGNVSYQPIPECDPHWAERIGFHEPELTFLPDGSMMMLLRTMDTCVGPMYASYSQDEGKTWSKPVFYDDEGVNPVMRTLANGVTVAFYGRPGLFVRATCDPAGKEWEDRVAIIPNDRDIMTDTCSYVAVHVLSEDTMYLVYSDFQCPNPQGVPVKSIVGRMVTAKVV